MNPAAIIHQHQDELLFSTSVNKRVVGKWSSGTIEGACGGIVSKASGTGRLPDSGCDAVLRGNLGGSFQRSVPNHVIMKLHSFQKQC